MFGHRSKAPEPVSALLAVLDDLWLPYGLNRDDGLDPDAALDASLAVVLVPPQLDDVLAFMAGERDAAYQLSDEQSGKVLRQETLNQAELIYGKLRLLPDWPH